MQNYEKCRNEEIKNNIIYSLEKKGILENLKAYLRSSIYTNLKEKEEPAKMNNSQIISVDLKESDYEKIKSLKLSISLISDFLKKMQFNYTHSVFLPECRNLIKDELYSDNELAKIYEISSEKLTDSKSISLLHHITKHKALKCLTQSSQTQTESTTDSSKKSFEDMDAKLKEIDCKYSKNITLENLMPAKSIEEKMLKYQREYDLRHKEDLEREIKRIKEIELSQIRIEENRKYLKRIDEVRDEYEKEFREKFESLKKKDLDVSMRINRKEKEVETQIYENRQKFLSELDFLKRKEDEMKRKYENELNNLRLEEEKIKFRQQEIDYIKESSSKKIKEEIEQFKLEYDRMFELERNENRKNKMDMEEKDFKKNLHIEKMKNFEYENSKFKDENDSLLREVNEKTKSSNVYKKEIENLREELKSFYSESKRKTDFFSKIELENSHLKEELKYLKDSLEIQKKSAEERKSDQAILIENIKIQLNENTRRYENNKEQFEKDIQNLNKYYQSSHEYQEKVKILENQKLILENEYKSILAKYNQLLKKSSEAKKKNLNKIINLNNQDFSNSYKAKWNNYLNDNKTSSDRFAIISKLEKEQEEIKIEFKKSFSDSLNKREDNIYYLSQTPKTMDRIYNELLERLNSEKRAEINSPEHKIDLQLSTKENIKQKVEEKGKDESSVNEDNRKKYYSFQNTETAKKTEEKINLSQSNQSGNNIAFSKFENVLQNQSRDSNEKIKELKQNLCENVSKSKSNSNIVEEVADNLDVETTNIKVSFKDEVILKFIENENYLNFKNEEIIQPNITGVSKEVDTLPSPIIVSGKALTRKFTIISDKHETINEISIANLTSSDEWENDSQKKDSGRVETNKLNKLEISNTKLMPEKISSAVFSTVKIYNENILQKSKSEEKEEQKHKNDNSNDKINSEKSNNIKHNIHQESNDKKILTTGENLAHKTINPKTNSPDSIHIQTENKIPTNFNKFSTFNFPVDNNEIEEDIKTEQDDSENYEYDFVEDVEDIDKKASIDIDAINRNMSITNNSININKQWNIENKSYLKSGSMDKYIDKFLQSKTSNLDENISEDISYENSRKEILLSPKTNSIEEDSALRYNDYYQSINQNQVKSNGEISENIYNDYYQSNVGLNSGNSTSPMMKITRDSAKENSQKFVESKTSDIGEEIIEEDAYEPVNHDDY